ncbi:autophagy-related protein 22-like protein [Halenospora varia]|nr:autophagy-related protein 22-like protein [Halenospora varia]
MSLSNRSDGRSDEDLKHPEDVNISPRATDLGVAGNGDEVTPEVSPMGTKNTLIAWLILCYSTGPTSSAASTYVTAAIQSAANLLGHVPGSTKAYAKRGTIKCVVKFGGGEIDYNSYTIYINAIGRAMEGVLTIFISGIADYSHYRKVLMMMAIGIFGAFALPLAGLSKTTYSNLTALSVLYCGMTTIQGIYVVIETSYIPIFMRSAGWVKPPARIGSEEARSEVANVERAAKHVLTKGTRVSVLGLASSNVGGLIALLIGIIITYTRGGPATKGYSNFLLAVAIAGCLTLCFALLSGILLLSVPGKTRPAGNLFVLPLKRWWRLIRSIQTYPQAFKLCIGWILWNTSYSCFLSVAGLLFREVSGLAIGDGLYTVYFFLNVIYACIGSLCWMFVFPYFNFPIKRWAYGFFFINILCVFWGTIGIANISVGYKHTVEFWVQQALFMSSSSALRSHNRVLYASLLPRGSEAQFFGLEITLDLATGWINTLVSAVIQDRTHNLRFPMLPALLLMLAPFACISRLM